MLVDKHLASNGQRMCRCPRAPCLTSWAAQLACSQADLLRILRIGAPSEDQSAMSPAMAPMFLNERKEVKASRGCYATTITEMQSIAQA